MLEPAEEGNRGWLVWKEGQLPAMIDWDDEVVAHGLRHRVKYARLVQRRASTERAAGADQQGYRYFVQLALEGLPLQKPKHPVGQDTIGADLGPSTIHGRKAHEIVAVGNTIIMEKLSYKAWQQQYGRSVGLRAPGMFVAPGPRTGGTLLARSRAASQTLAVLPWL